MTWLGKLRIGGRRNESATESDPSVEITPNPELVEGQGTRKACSANAESLDPVGAHFWSKAVSLMGTQAGKAANTVREGIVQSLVAGIRTVSTERDRDEILRWFVDARQVLSDPTLSRSEAAAQLHKSVDTIRTGKLIANIAATGLQKYGTSDLPLALKVALPVTALGTALLGAQGAGIAAFGGAIGAPVVLLLFLGQQERHRSLRRSFEIKAFETLSQN